LSRRCKKGIKIEQRALEGYKDRADGFRKKDIKIEQRALEGYKDRAEGVRRI